MRTIKSLFMVLVAVLLSCNMCFAISGYTSAKGSTIIEPSIVDGTFGVTIFNDQPIATGKQTHWSNPIYIGNLDFTRGSNRNVAYFTLGVAHGNTQTTADITCTYQISHDGLNFAYAPQGYAERSVAGNDGLFATTSTDGFDPGDTSAISVQDGDICPPVTVTSGVGPYCITKTSLLEVTVCAAKYIRFKAYAINDTIFDLFMIGATRQIEAD